MTTWTYVRDEAMALVKSDVAAQWPLIQVRAAAQIQAFIAAASYAQEHRHEIPADEYALIMQHQQQCLEATLSGFRDIGETLARNSAAKVAQLIGSALLGP